MPQRATRPVLASLSGVLLVLGGCRGGAGGALESAGRRRPGAEDAQCALQQ